MRAFLRTLIALNWTVVGVAFSMALYGYSMVHRNTVEYLALSEMSRHSTKSLPLTPGQRVETYIPFDEMRNGTEGLYHFGSVAWWGLVFFGCVNAVGLIVIFRHTQPARFTGREELPAD